MKYPLVSDLAASGIPVAVTCRVLEIARQPYYRWLAHPITEAELVEAYRLNALIDAHHDDPEFGYRYLADEAADAGVPMATRTAWRLCSTQGLSSSISTRKKGNGTRPGPPVHDDLVQRQFSSVTEVNTVWFTDITEHHTREGKLYCCAIKDACSRRIVGYAIDTRMKASLAVRALDNAVANRSRDGAEVVGCVVHSDYAEVFVKPRNLVLARSAADQWGFLGLTFWVIGGCRAPGACRQAASLLPLGRSRVWRR